jgi:predicted ester cyclase
MRMEIDGIKPPNPDSEVTPEETLRFVRDLLEAWNAHDVERIKTFSTPDYEGVDVGQTKTQSGPKSVARLVKRYLQAFPDLRFVGEDVVQGNRAVLVWTTHGTHGGELIRIPPTGRDIEVRGTSILTVENGKVICRLYIWDVAGLL